MIYYVKGSEKDTITNKQLEDALYSALDKLGNRNKVLAVTPGITRYHSMAGEITGLVYKYYKDNLTGVLPATGTHYPMTEQEIETMYPLVPKSLFRIHRWREDLHTFGEVPSDFINEVSEG